jgi:mRNA guanylyltransferase
MDANHVSTVEKVLESIEDRITEDDLIRIAPTIKTAWKKRQAGGSSAQGRSGPPAVNGNGVKRKFEE